MSKFKYQINDKCQTPKERDIFADTRRGTDGTRVPANRSGTKVAVVGIINQITPRQSK